MARKVLVVDDEPEIRHLFREVLERKGYDVETASSGSDAVAKANRKRFDVIFLDIRMPGMDGVEAQAALSEINPEAAVVMITGYASSHLVEQSLSAGALLCLVKPFGIAQILEVLAALEDGGQPFSAPGQTPTP